ncbi:insulin-like growth factor binding protein [Flammula alnicola]|nr:insulin-like growth factor binding protein [Flammula alnicola]
MFGSLDALSLLLFLPISIIAQSTPTILCIAGQCLQGNFNTTIGATVFTPGTTTSIHLLPGVYTTTTNPQLLHDSLTASSVSITSSPGFNISSPIFFPLNLALQPGVSFYANTLYSGQASFTALPSAPIGNTSTPLTASALALSSNVWVALNAGSNNRIIVWDAIPDVGQLPSRDFGSLSLLDVQSAACTPSCSGSGVCTASGTCQCPAGFTGSSCETCASGFFGPNCQPCPANCTTCDEGITGSGRCLKPTIANAPATCKCKSGVCGANGTCACNPGFTTGDDGTLCSKCLPGFFLTSSGDCQICQLGCTQCADGTGECVTCKSGFSQNGNDRTKCNPPQSSTTGGQLCPDGSFANGASCSPCSSTCQTCTAGTSNDCIICAAGTFTNNGGCVSANSVGVCQGTNLIADNNKRECDSCGATCTQCEIPAFSVASTVDQKQCTACLPGFFLSNGTCVENCPSGTTISSQDNLTCIPCDSSCTTCAGSSTFCLTCANNQLASGGKCVSACPSSTFSSSGSCLNCHPDCASCSGGAFNQCTSCPSNRPVLTNGRCLPTCSKTQFFELTSSSCQTCDSSCSSCSGAGPSNCLACSSSSQVLRGGTCVAANCQSNSSVIAGLGVCLSDLVPQLPVSGGNTTLPPAPGIDTSTTVVKTRRLEWWQILLMALGCAFIFLVVIWCCRRRQRKKRANKMDIYSPDYGRSWRWKLIHWVRKLFGHKEKAPNHVHASSPIYFNSIHDDGHVANRTVTAGVGWRWKLVRWGERLFGHTPSRPMPTIVHLGPVREDEDVKVHKLRALEEARTPTPAAADVDMVRLIGSYNRTPSPEPSRYYHQSRYTRVAVTHQDSDQRSISDASSHMSAPSIYSQLTGAPRRVPDPRQPVKKDLTSRFSASTFGVGEQSHTKSSKHPFHKPF